MCRIVGWNVYRLRGSVEQRLERSGALFNDEQRGGGFDVGKREHNNGFEDRNDFGCCISGIRPVHRPRLGADRRYVQCEKHYGDER